MSVKHTMLGERFTLRELANVADCHECVVFVEFAPMKIPLMNKYALLPFVCFLMTLSVHAEVSMIEIFKPGEVGMGWDPRYPGIYEDAELNQETQSHTRSHSTWTTPENYGFRVWEFALSSVDKGNAVRKMADELAFKEGRSFYFSALHFGQLTGGSRLAFARAGVLPDLFNANIQLRQVANGAYAIFEENRELARTDEAYFQTNVLLIGYLDYNAGVFKLKVVPAGAAISPVEQWDIVGAIRPSGTYDRVIWRAADNARFGQFVAGDRWADVTGIQ
jgi:hypothetical protein